MDCFWLGILSFAMGKPVNTPDHLGKYLPCLVFPSNLCLGGENIRLYAGYVSNDILVKGLVDQSAVE